MADSGQRTEQPTLRRLEKAKREGQFPTSREFVSAVQFACFLAIAISYSSEWFLAARFAMRQLLELSFRIDINQTSVLMVFRTIARQLVVPLLMAGGFLAVMTLAAQFLTTRFGIALGKLAPDFERLNPANRIRNLPKTTVPQFFQALALLPLFCLAVWVVASRSIESFLQLPRTDLAVGLLLVATSLRDLLWRAAELFLVVGIIDLVYQRHRWMSGMKMSKQDIREETKEVEGDPHTKMRIRRLQRDLLRRRMMKEVETATAVVVNPTHFAVALRYVPSEMPAPKVVAKGKNFLAQRIRERARQHQVPIVENQPLAQALYKSAQVGQDIPPHLYRAVAEVLAYIYRLMHTGSGLT